MDVRHNNNALKELNDCIGGLLHLGLNVITFRTLLHLGPNVITFRSLLHLGQLLHLGLQQMLRISLKEATTEVLYDKNRKYVSNAARAFDLVS